MFKLVIRNFVPAAGWICTGVTKGFAGIKFSGSPRTQGPQKQIMNKIKSAAKNPMAIRKPLGNS